MTKRLKLGSCSFYYNVLCSPMPYLSACKFDYEGSPLDREAQTGMEWFSIEFATLYLGNDASLGDN